jgi:hypothetical protein
MRCGLSSVGVPFFAVVVGNFQILAALLTE